MPVRLLSRLRALVWRSRVEQEIDEELRYHLERHKETLVRDGMSPGEAHHASMRAFGGVQQAKEQIRDTAKARWLEEIGQDTVYAVRVLRKRPAFSLIAIFTLALGIGANTSIFSVVNTLFLQPLPGIDHPERLLSVSWDNTGLGPSYPDYVEYRSNTKTLEGLATYSSVTLHMGAGSNAERVQGELVSGNYFDVLGVSAQRGRVLVPGDDTAPRANPVAVISDRLANRLGRAESVVGQTLRLNAAAYTIVGITSAGFNGVELGRKSEIWIPISMTALADPTAATSRETRVARGWLKSFARIRKGVTIGEAQAELSRIARSLAETHPETNKNVGIKLTDNLGLGPRERTRTGEFARLLAAVAGLVLLIACANVANLMLARSHERRKEIGTRLALGASRLRVIRQLLTESVIIGLAGGAAGALLAYSLGRPIMALISSEGTDFSTLEIRPDIRVLVFTLVVSIVTGVLFGIFPALEASRMEITHAIRPLPRHFRFLPVSSKDVLVTAQVALSLVLLVAASLLVRTLQKVQSVQPGFNADRVLMARIDSAKQGYPESRGRLFYQQIVDRIEAVPGVRAASVAHVVPLKDPTWRTRILPVDLPLESENLAVDYNTVGPAYFDTMGIPLIAGRDFDRVPLTHGSQGETGVAILNETLARRLFPGSNPIGKQLIRFSGGKPRYRLEVIGVVRDSKYRDLTEPPTPQMYLPSFQFYRPAMTLLIRTDQNPMSVVASLRREVQGLDESMPVFETRALSELVSESLAPRRSAVTLTSGFGILGLVLACLGLYGVMAYIVTQSTREIGIRMALGAQRSGILAHVFRHAALLVFSGIIFGIAGSFFAAGLLKKFLFDVSTLDWVTFATVPALLILAVIPAVWVPARRASAVDPMLALRCE